MMWPKQLAFSVSCMFISLLSFLTMESCGEDRTYQFEEATACGHWMQETLQEYYLWGDSVKELSWKEYFGEPATVFERFVKQAPVTDSWSWCSVDTTEEDHHQRGYFNHLDSYGIDFVLMSDPTSETSRTYARIISVYPDSPAERCSLQRGDFIGAIDGTRLSSSIATRLISGTSRQLEVSQLGVDDSLSSFIWTSTDTLMLSASTYVEDKPFPVLRSFRVGGQRVAYLLCNRLTCGPTEQDTTSQAYVQELSDIMEEVRDLTPQILVLDLRLCNDGTLDMSRRLASYLVNGLSNESVFAKTIYRSDQSARNEDIPFDNSIMAKNLGINQLFIVTSSYTCGAAEWLVRGLRAAMGEDFVTIIGTTTAGQLVNTMSIPSTYCVTLHPAVCYVADETGDYDYSGGISPDVEIDEFEYAVLYPYGDESETVLATILNNLAE